MSFESYSGEKYMENESVRDIILDAFNHNVIIDEYASDFDPRLGGVKIENVLKKIGVGNSDSMEVVKEKLQSALLASDSVYISRHIEEICAMSSDFLDFLRESGAAQNSDDISSLKLKKGETIYSDSLDGQQSISELREKTLKSNVKRIRSVLKITLQWLNS